MGATAMGYRPFGGISLTSTDSIRPIKPEWIPPPKLTVPPAKTLADKIAQFKPDLSVAPA